jgi:hypothetical protein
VIAPLPGLLPSADAISFLTLQSRILAENSRYSFGGHVQQPRQLLPGGYISFINPETDEFQQILFLGAEPVLRNLGPASGSSLRQFVDGKTYPLVIRDRKRNEKLSEWCNTSRQHIEAAAIHRGKSFEFGEEALAAKAK